MERFYLRAVHVHAPTHDARRFVTGRAAMGFLSLGTIEEARPVTTRTARKYMRAWDASGQGAAYSPNGGDPVPLRMLPWHEVCESCGSIEEDATGCAECRPEAQRATPAPVVVREPWTDEHVHAAKRERDERAEHRAMVGDAYAWHTTHNAQRLEPGGIQREASFLVRAWRTHGTRRFERMREGYFHAQAIERAAQRGDAHALPEHVQQWARKVAYEQVPDEYPVHVQWGERVERSHSGAGFIVPAFVYVDAPDWMDDDGADEAQGGSDGEA